MILANGAVVILMPATIFYAFWILLILRDPAKISAQDKNLYEQMFATVTPDQAEKLPLPKMNMAGLVKSMLLTMMDEKQTPTLKIFWRELNKSGIEKGARSRLEKLIILTWANSLKCWCKNG